MTQSDTCRTCGQNVPLGANFCSQCGSNLTSDSASNSPIGESVDTVGSVGPGVGREPRFQTADGECPQCWTPVKNLATFCGRCGQPLRQRRAKGVPYAVASIGRPAGLWTRGWAVIIDAIIIFAASAAIWPLLFGESYWDSNQTPFWYVRVEIGFQPGDWQWIVWFIYRFLFIAVWGATPGKFAVRVRVLNEHGKHRIGVIRSFVWAVGWEISAIILFMGFIISIFREDKRALHDLIARTYPVILDPTRKVTPIQNDQSRQSQ